MAEVCEERGCAWSVYRCIGDRYVDGLFDERIVALTNQDGSGNLDGIRDLIAAEPDVGAKLERLSRETGMAAGSPPKPPYGVVSPSTADRVAGRSHWRGADGARPIGVAP